MISPRTSTTPTICLTMIVKNEAPILARCLESVLPLVTRYSIVDTGSTDGTQDVIRKALAGFSGEIHERPWKDFGHNRTEAIALARGKADYNLVIDADDILSWPEGFTMPALDRDLYDLEVEDAGIFYWRSHLFRNDLPFQYVGVLHEWLEPIAGCNRGKIEGLRYHRLDGGARSRDPEKFRKDAAVLNAALVRDPKNTRYVFYLGQSYRDAGDFAEAAKAYKKRSTMGGWAEEAWYALFECARMTEWLKQHDRVAGAYLAAYNARPERAEPLCELARYLRMYGFPAAAYPIARMASEIPKPTEGLFVEDAVYAWRARDELAIAAYYVGRFQEGFAINDILLTSSELPETECARVEQNRALCRAKIKSEDT
jgi:glycosyltransferase involved in cell wall biosynthesis